MAAGCVFHYWNLACTTVAPILPPHHSAIAIVVKLAQPPHQEPPTLKSKPAMKASRGGACWEGRIRLRGNKLSPQVPPVRPLRANRGIPKPMFPGNRGGVNAGLRTRAAYSTVRWCPAKFLQYAIVGKIQEKPQMCGRRIMTDNDG